MKLISLLLFSFFMGSQVLAASDKVEYISSYGSASSYCNSNSYFCVDSIERRAISDAQRDADYQCRSRGGRLDSSTSGCYANCNPSYIPPNQSTWVNCRANCSLRCYIPQDNN